MSGVGQIAAALAKAQAKMQPPKKDKTAKIESGKGGYSYHYSDLSSLIDAIRGPLAENGIAFTQAIQSDEGNLTLETRLIHESGEEIRSVYPLKVYDRPQEQGSAITYARRYALGALVGLAPEDDDGKAAQTAEPVKADPKRSDVVSRILDIADQLVMMNGGNPGELIARASAFLPDADTFTPEERWMSDKPFQKGVKSIKTVQELEKMRSVKWQGRILAELLHRLEDLRRGGDEASDAEAEALKAQYDDDAVPF